MTALFVDDEQGWLDLVRIAAEGVAPDLRVVTARSAEEGARAAVATRPDVAVVDLRMPDVGGDALLYFLRRELPQTRVLVCSAYLTRAVEAALEATSIPFCRKPVELERLLRWACDPSTPCAA